MPIALIIHGGAGRIPDNRVEANLAGCKAALQAGWDVLAAGASALDACEAAIRLLEDDPTFNAGTGSVLNADGEVEMDAALMDGRSLAYGAVANIQHVRNPIVLARRVLQGPGTFLAGAGAERFAMAEKLSLCPNQDLIVPRERRRWQRLRSKYTAPSTEPPETQTVPAPIHSRAAGHDTVGAIALDQQGGLVAANSTGGTPFKLPGRVGDTPMIGCGLYADAHVGACVATGWGESIVRVALARRALELMEHGVSPHAAARHAVALLSRQVARGDGGCILMNTNGEVGLAWNTSRMAYAYRIDGGAVMAGV